MHRKPIIIGWLALVSLIGGCDLWVTSQPNSATWNPTQARQTVQEANLLDICILGGPQNPEDAAAITEARKVLEKVQRTPGRSQALYLADCGILAMHANGVNLAKEALDQSLVTVGSITVGGDAEREVTKQHGQESAKIFKGEAHERVIIYLYRGLLYLAEKDYDNAHACFLSACLQDAGAQPGGHGNWMSVDLLRLFCERGMDSTSCEEFARHCQTTYPQEAGSFGEPLYRKVKHPLVIALAVGQPPLKTTAKAGKDGVALGYVPSPSQICQVRLVSGGHAMELPATDDVYVQAATRGQRHMDEILAKKVREARQTDDTGRAVVTVAIIGGSIIPGLSYVGMAVQEAAMHESSKQNAFADVRQLYSVPNTLHVAVMDRSVLSATVTIEALDRNGSVRGRREISIPAEADGPIVIVGRIPY